MLYILSILGCTFVFGACLAIFELLVGPSPHARMVINSSGMFKAGLLNAFLDFIHELPCRFSYSVNYLTEDGDPGQGMNIENGVSVPSCSEDLNYLKATIEPNGDKDSPWHLMFEKNVEQMVKYAVYRRTLLDGLTEYKSVSVYPRTTPRYITQFFLDDSYRLVWDNFLHSAEVLAAGDLVTVPEVVRWVRRLPFGLLKDREYIIERKVVEEGSETVYGITKGLSNPPETQKGTVRVEKYWSMWKSTSVPDPWGGPEPACETTLLHAEDLRVAEKLAGLVVSVSLWRFVKGMVAAIQNYQIDCKPTVSGDSHLSSANTRLSNSTRQECKAEAGSGALLVAGRKAKLRAILRRRCRMEAAVPLTEDTTCKGGPMSWTSHAWPGVALAVGFYLLVSSSGQHPRGFGQRRAGRGHGRKHQQLSIAT